LRDGFAQPRDRPRAAEHGDDLVDSGTDGTAGQRDAHRLCELAELHTEAGEHFLEDALDRGLREIASQLVEFIGEREQLLLDLGLQKFRGCLRIDIDVIAKVKFREVDQLDESFGAFLERRDHLFKPRIVAVIE